MRLLLLMLLFPCAVLADGDNFNYDAFAHIPVLHEGRIKPLDSFARVSLKKIYGNTSLPNQSALEWLAEVMFAPADAMRKKIFAVPSLELAHMLSLPARLDGDYNFIEIAAAFFGREEAIQTLLAKDKKSLSENEQALLHLYMSANSFAEIRGSFSLILPFEDSPDLNYLSVLKDERRIDAALAQTVKRKGDKIDSYTPKEQRNASLAYHMHMLQSLDGNNSLLRVMQPTWEGAEEWLAPWAVIEKGAGSPKSAALFQDWQALARAYAAHDAVEWNMFSQKLYDAGSSVPGVRPWALSLEVTYNALNVLEKSLWGYAAGALLVLVALIKTLPLSYQKPVFINAENVDKKTELSGIQPLFKRCWMPAFAGMKILKIAYLIVLLGAATQGLALLIRMAILLRPPVSTLYESMIFVSFVSVCCGLWLEYRKKGGENLLMGAVIAWLLLLAANVFAADSDTLEVLVAVLNTNFWLATHVVCITTGYATALIAGAIAHVYLMKRALGASREELVDLQRQLHSVALVALLFTAVGTMLGGIWADQSWGRFWGWDPKENGALLIVLWLIWALHGRISGQLQELGFACAMALITVVVALAWVGVNLLSAGLHSYGFTDIAANGLMIFCSAEIVIVGGLVIATSRARWLI